MEMKRMIVGLVLIAAFALPAFVATLEKDFISHETLKSVLEKVNPGSKVAMLNEQTVSVLTGKILISNPLIEELLKQSTIRSLAGSFPCGESCVWLPCISGPLGCSYSNNVCYYNSTVSDV